MPTVALYAPYKILTSARSSVLRAGLTLCEDIVILPQDMRFFDTAANAQPYLDRRALELCKEAFIASLRRNVQLRRSIGGIKWEACLVQPATVHSTKADAKPFHKAMGEGKISRKDHMDHMVKAIHSALQRHAKSMADLLAEQQRSIGEPSEAP